MTPFHRRIVIALTAAGLCFPAEGFDGPPPLPRDDLPPLRDLDSIPPGLAPKRPVPADNPLTAAKVRLGRRLFFDPILSADRTVACASCHNPAHGFTTPAPVAVGVHGRKGTRNAPTLFNAAWGKTFFWDGRAGSLEEQALMPIQNKNEMGAALDEVLLRLRSDESYVEEFRGAFADGVTAKNLARAIASFERTLLAGNSPVDRFRHGETEALSSSEKQGLWLFESKAGCWKCHSGANFTDGKFHNTGVGWGNAPADFGRFRVTGRDEDRGAFKTPTLRGVAATGPYMHDGSLPTLEEVVRYYNRGGNKNPHLSRHLRPLNLTDREIRDLTAFLQAFQGPFQPAPGD